MPLQERVILLLEGGSAFSEVKDILKSPLGLVEELVRSCFAEDQNEGLLRHERELDEIKKRVAGTARSHSLSDSYKIAKYSPYLFAFQQYFHSSYRARQGGALEGVVYYSLKSANVNPLKMPKEKRIRLKELFGIEARVGYDIDIMAENSDDLLLGQIRSTDVTGGTTAKGSLVDLLRFILRQKSLDPSTRYLIIVWEPLDRQQKPSLINKVWDSLRSQLGEENETTFKEHIDEGWRIPNTNISIKLIYGINELGHELNDFAGSESAGNKLTSLWESIQRWDDLWLTYAIASLELENLIFHNFTNFEILDKKLEELKITISVDDLRNYEERSKEMAGQILKEWKESTLPVSMPAEILNYLRDLVLLKMVNKKVGGDRNSRSETIQSLL